MQATADQPTRLGSNITDAELRDALSHVDAKGWFTCRLTPTPEGYQAVVCGRVVGEYSTLVAALGCLERCCKLVGEKHAV